MSKTSEKEFSDGEIARRRDVVVRRMANTPPQPRVKPPARPLGKKKTTGQDQRSSDADKDRA